ncbi:MAG: hypothetical protein JKX69_11085 [Rhodobacteraceae bacterium]|nr:hypothetical protein [Paracoccaceae bacterium]
MKQEASSHRGGVPVGELTELGPVEAGAVLYLRLWSGSPACRATARKDFDRALGISNGAAALNALDEIFELFLRFGRRGLVRHQLRCKCLGADEACFANFIAAAAEGEREDAIMLASLMVRPDVAPAAAALAQSFGLALRRMSVPDDFAVSSQGYQAGMVH